jgi:hypothetical protein
VPSSAVLVSHVLSDLLQCFFVANTGITKDVTEITAVNIETDINANMASLVSVFNLILYNAMRLSYLKGM